MWACLLGGWLGFGVYAGCVRCGCLRFLVLARQLGGGGGVVLPPRLFACLALTCRVRAAARGGLGGKAGRAVPLLLRGVGESGEHTRAHRERGREGLASGRAIIGLAGGGGGVRVLARTIPSPGSNGGEQRAREREGGASFRPDCAGLGVGWWLPGSGCGRAVTVRGSKIDTTGAGAIVRSWPWWQFHGGCAWVVLGAWRFPLGGGVAWW